MSNAERANQAESYGAPIGLSDSPKPGQVHRHHAVAVGQRGDGREERGLRAARGRGGRGARPARRRRTASTPGRPRVRSALEREPPGLGRRRWWRRGSRRPGAASRASRSLPRWNACMPPRTSPATRSQVVGSAAIVASGSLARAHGAQAQPVARDAGVPVVAAAHAQAHQRAPARDVDHVRVVALSQRLDSAGRALRRRGDGHLLNTTVAISPTPAISAGLRTKDRLNTENL